MIPSTVRAVAVALAVVATSSFAAPSKTYQVTGPVLEIDQTKIVVQKGSEKWEILRDPSTKVEGELKVGAKVTISYTMTAVSASVKADKGAK